jgi:hypothetical protein
MSSNEYQQEEKNKKTQKRGGPSYIDAEEKEEVVDGSLASKGAERKGKVKQQVHSHAQRPGAVAVSTATSAAAVATTTGRPCDKKASHTSSSSSGQVFTLASGMHVEEGGSHDKIALPSHHKGQELVPPPVDRRHQSPDNGLVGAKPGAVQMGEDQDGAED